MSKIAVVYWTGTGNTEAMANAVAEGAKEQGAEVSVFTSAEFTSDMVAEYDGIAFGCPAMGDEVLEEDEFEPLFNNCIGVLGDKKVVLFGSYGWGDGEWMRNWEASSREQGLNLAADGLIWNDAPDEEGVEACKALGAAVSK
ncbi:MAG: flavodoxin [Lachnospiraceae bacterium]|nr:flavodoxin [Lachnospiraceae bacterium]